MQSIPTLQHQARADQPVSEEAVPSRCQGDAEKLGSQVACSVGLATSGESVTLRASVSSLVPGTCETQ